MSFEIFTLLFLALEPLVRIFPIDTTTYLHEIKVSVNSLDTLSVVTLECKCQDQRTIDFTKALIDFSAWELEKTPDCLWYVYPSFVLEFMKHPPSWSSWRTRTERASRGSKEERYIIYFNALKEELKEQGDDRRAITDYPWDDEHVSIMEDLREEKKIKDAVSLSSPSTVRVLSFEEKLAIDMRKKEREEERKREADMRRAQKKIEEEEKRTKALEKKRRGLLTLLMQYVLYCYDLGYLGSHSSFFVFIFPLSKNRRRTRKTERVREKKGTVRFASPTKFVLAASYAASCDLYCL